MPCWTSRLARSDSCCIPNGSVAQVHFGKQQGPAWQPAYGWRDITTTSLLPTPLPSDSHWPLGDHAKLKIFPYPKRVIWTGGPPVSGTMSSGS